MDEFINITAHDYSQWLVITMTKILNGDPNYFQLQAAYKRLMDDLEHLEKCLAMEPYDRKE